MTERRPRRSIRMTSYDYASPGAYFVTACAHARACLFGGIDGGEMTLNQYGNIVHSEWLRSAEIRYEIELDEFVIMPNHIHAIVSIVRDGRGDRLVAPTGPRPKSLSSLLAGFKASATKRINQARGTPGAPVWQRNYYERVVRNERELTRVREYIRLNPLKWAFDHENPHKIANREYEMHWGWLQGDNVGATGRSPLRDTLEGRP